VATASEQARAALLVHAAAYVFATLGVFAVLASLAHRGQEARSFDDFRGLGRSRPLLAGALGILLLSLAGVPGTGGFTGRWQILSAAVAEGRIVLALLVAGSSVILLHAYLRLPVASARTAVTSGTHRERTDFLELGVLAGCLAVVAVLGWAPNRLPWLQAIDWTRAAAEALAR